MMNLIVNVYESPHKERQRELEWCIMENLANPHLNVIPIDQQENPTVQQLIDVANRLSGPDTVSILANSDIVFDDSIALAECIPYNTVYTLARWEPLMNYYREGDKRKFDGIIRESAELKDSAYYSQDAWIWRGELKLNSPADYQMGKPGIDNRFASDISRSGYRVFNPAKDIKIYHVHGSGYRTYIPGGPETVPGPHLEVPVCSLDDIAQQYERFVAGPTDVDELKPPPNFDLATEIMEAAGRFDRVSAALEFLTRIRMDSEDTAAIDRHIRQLKEEHNDIVRGIYEL